jgi:hypothetical protein
MTKKHFIALAKIFSKHNAKGSGNILNVLYDVCELCGEENPNFDKARFLKACGITEETLF